MNKSCGKRSNVAESHGGLGNNGSRCRVMLVGLVGGVFFSVVTEFLTSCDSEFLQFVHLLTVNVA